MFGSNYVLVEDGGGKVITGRSMPARRHRAATVALHGCVIDVIDPSRVHIGGMEYNTVRHGYLGGAHPPEPGKYLVRVVYQGSPEYPAELYLDRI